MRPVPWLRAEQFRVPFYPGHPYYSAYGDPFGFFEIPGPCSTVLRCIVSMSGPPTVDEDKGWNHVSVSTKNRCPNWVEMCLIKEVFFRPEDCTMQLHPPQSENVNLHPFCLHMWEPTLDVIPRPPSILVGPDSAKGKKDVITA